MSDRTIVMAHYLLEYVIKYVHNIQYTLGIYTWYESCVSYAIQV